MVGGFCVLKDVPKTLVYKLANYINNTKKNIIPKRIISREPTAELKFNQTDQDSLPSYDILDSIINLYIEQKISPKAIVRQGFDSQVVKKVVELIHGNEFKRRQSAPGPKITSKAFSVDRRYPITNRYKPKI
jgi:NAD+ synthase (glutamine-hydrolysing)